MICMALFPDLTEKQRCCHGALAFQSLDPADRKGGNCFQQVGQALCRVGVEAAVGTAGILRDLRVDLADALIVSLLKHKNWKAEFVRFGIDVRRSSSASIRACATSSCGC